MNWCLWRQRRRLGTLPFKLARALMASAGRLVLAARLLQHAGLVQLQTLYRDFAQTGAGLQAIAVRELPKVEQTISALDAL